MSSSAIGGTELVFADEADHVAGSINDRFSVATCACSLLCNFRFFATVLSNVWIFSFNSAMRLSR